MKIINIPQTKTRAMAAVVMMLCLSACNNDLMTKKDAIKYGPDERNPPEEIAQSHQQAEKIEPLIIEADQALARKDFEQAEIRYKAILALDSNQLRAKEGLRRVTIQRQHQVWLKEAKPLIGRSDAAEERAKTLLSKILIELDK